MLDFALVREALKERGLLLERLAPHLVKPVPFLYPLQHKGWERLYAGSGVALYDAMSMSRGHGRGLPMHRHLTRRQALRVAPALQEGRAESARCSTTTRRWTTRVMWRRWCARPRRTARRSPTGRG